ncbi:HypC/HybG/HupF family hydrogenase formation chaperone [Pseudenhygromyxa sp. WMMC2535]|uniref:HypC/HybG/HupF family hydrogenase formation chaperone n=1 Tax=Pseudenhygromyxa sp. WMMC2535 TaxID=2712867 RepID=UPI001552C58A|nr:HypC/HybG/HupF family hydrogenase formation chaperone [Pseudenhygromyxa sp. WMMC2535]NVB40871.1 HypC/HybG/HupF family hydrogenase formation chaperone [Pseudenhygromyxa sp. WMMC2535]
MCLGIPGQVVAIEDAEKKLGVVEIGGVRRVTNLACVVDDDHPIASCVGDWVLVHVGFAMSRVDVEEAQRTLALLEELGEVQAELEAMRAQAGAQRPPSDRFPGRSDS